MIFLSFNTYEFLASLSNLFFINFWRISVTLRSLRLSYSLLHILMINSKNSPRHRVLLSPLASLNRVALINASSTDALSILNASSPSRKWLTATVESISGNSDHLSLAPSQSWKTLFSRPKLAWSIRMHSCMISGSLINKSGLKYVLQSSAKANFSWK